MSNRGGFLSGEVKLAITIHLLDGGDALDIGVIFDIYPTSLMRICYEAINKWIIPSKIGNIGMESYLSDEVAISRVRKGFLKRSNGVLVGAIGEIDGWLVRIQRPSFRSDRIIN